MAAADLLRNSPVFARFDEATLARLGDRFAEVEIPANQVLIEPRTAGAGLFVICEGTVLVEAHDREWELGEGEIIGEISLLEPHGTRRARVIAKTPVRCLALSRSEFDRMREELPELDAAVQELAQHRLSELEPG
jgi:CRP-like cAMP-binding protein